jgi:hypothetical protein
MKKAVGFLSAILLVVTIVGVAGCSSGSKPVGTMQDRAVRMMQMVPANSSYFDFIDIYKLRTDENFSSTWAYFKEYYLDNESISEKINSVATTDSLYIYEGDFTLAQLMGSTNNGSYNYGGLKISTSTDNMSAVMINSSAVNGYDDDVRSCIDVVNGNKSSLYDNEDVQAVMSRLPSGIELGMQIVDNSSSSEEPVGLLLEGVSYDIFGSDYVQTLVYQFNSSSTAQKYVANASNVSEDGTMSLNRTLDGVFVTEVMTPLTSTPTPTPTPTSTPTPTPTP